MKVLIIDNYDSFTYNLVEILRSFQVEIEICYCDNLTNDKIRKADKVLISPGPGLPEQAGKLLPTIKQNLDKPILGVCLGHQAVGQIFGFQLQNLSKPCHGKTILVDVCRQDAIFDQLPKQLQVVLYHSWILSPDIPPLIEVTARHCGQLMAIRHKSFNVRGVQFHPEGYATPHGVQMIGNWLKLC